jgi:chemotaxis protein methyltransferase CheR
MDIYCNGAKEINISVTENILSKDDVQKLLSAFDAERKEINISFLQADILPQLLVERLYLAQREKLCNITVYKRYLYSYLYTLGIQSRFIVPKTNQLENIRKQNLDCKEDMNREEIEGFLQEVFFRYGYDYRNYEIGSIIRRIKVCMLRGRFKAFEEFKKNVLENSQSFEELFLDFSINITEFFRDPEVFETIKKDVFPHLSTYPQIRIWCAGCSTGEEPYSLVILLKEAGLLHKTRIYATDINPYVIEEAKNGLYAVSNLDNCINNYRNAGGEKNFLNYFELKGDYMKVREELQKNILFFQHSLIGSGIINEFQLILCRNVLIYFNQQLQQATIKYLHDSLDISGFLVLEKSSGILQCQGTRYFDYFDRNNKVYKRR